MLRANRISTMMVLFCAFSASLAMAASAEEPTFNAEEKAALDKGDPVFREEQFKDAKGHRAGQGVAYILAALRGLSPGA